MEENKKVKIQFDLRESDNYVATLSIKDTHIAFEFAQDVNESDKQELSKYFSENIPNWENAKFNNDAGEFTFSKNPYESLMYIFASQIVKDKKDKFGMKYIISLKFPRVLTQDGHLFYV